MPRNPGHLGWVFALTVVLSCATTQQTGSARTPDPVASTYPADMAARGIEGDVILALTVLPDGSTSDVTVEKSAGAAFDRAAVENARVLKFRPANRDGVPVAARIRWAYRFRLERDR